MNAIVRERNAKDDNNVSSVDCVFAFLRIGRDRKQQEFKHTYTKAALEKYM